MTPEKTVHVQAFCDVVIEISPRGSPCPSFGKVPQVFELSSSFLDMETNELVETMLIPVDVVFQQHCTKCAP